MTLQQLLFDDTVDQVSLVDVSGCSTVTDKIKIDNATVTPTSICNSRGSLQGGSLSSVSRKGDLENTISLSTAGVYVAKRAFREGSPYYRQYIDNVLYVLPTYHFLVELRRQLSGEVVNSTFSEAEQLMYDEYFEWADGVTKEGELLLAIETLDKWLIDEVMLLTHPQLIRDYEGNHPWLKTGTRG